MDYNKAALEMHETHHGKVGITSKVEVKTRDDLSTAYTPGVAEPCLEIQKDVDKSYELTRRSNLVAVVTDGTAVLGLGDIGPEAGMPVMEGKCSPVQSLWRRGRHSPLRAFQGSGRHCKHRAPFGRKLRRREFGGHFRAPLL